MTDQVKIGSILNYNQKPALVLQIYKSTQSNLTIFLAKQNNKIICLTIRK